MHLASGCLIDAQETPCATRERHVQHTCLEIIVQDGRPAAVQVVHPRGDVLGEAEDHAAIKQRHLVVQHLVQRSVLHVLHHQQWRVSLRRLRACSHDGCNVRVPQVHHHLHARNVVVRSSQTPTKGKSGLRWLYAPHSIVKTNLHFFHEILFKAPQGSRCTSSPGVIIGTFAQVGQFLANEHRCTVMGVCHRCGLYGIHIEPHRKRTM